MIVSKTSGQEMFVQACSGIEFSVPGTPLDSAIAELLQSMNRGQYTLFAEAVRQLGGEFVVSPAVLESASTTPAPRISIDLVEGKAVIKLR